ncbi:hypothetical protein M440DRAFT_1339313 [Trichoderma longibrachiatum ATCC 18648]|uniref:BRCT domain-containing protein n=1 Tax=Trichoderma longibrachiatum ATCC 18648 TaxID=983965 RepID=A0A2T4BVI8_TRILO|nr:hypothetical protein M440DRAFT_1339313 [Trichoderma longibrachiatum ATCC 18648]
MSPPDGNPLSRITATRRFDPWNSSATGHQRAETQPGTGWRHSRNRKLNSQFGACDGSGGKRLSDTWGAGAENAGVDDAGRSSGRGRAGRASSSSVRDGGSKKSSVMDMLTRPGLMRKTLESNQTKQANARDGHAREFIVGDANLTAEERLMQQRRLEDEERQKQAQENPRKLFDGVTVYVNGSTFPLVSDHRLKQLISENGGNMSLNLGRRKVTHVILGRPNGSTEGKGLGGGLAATKLEKEIRKIGGCGVKFVSVEWVLQSLQEGRRLPEARFSNVKMAAKAQNSVYGLYTKHDAGSRATSSDPAP